MTTNDQDLRALTYLARRLRDETQGARTWDEAGTFAVIKAELAGTHLRTALERVIAHACDPEAKTPGAIRRPFEPKAETPGKPHVAYDPRKVCSVCGNGKAFSGHGEWSAKRNGLSDFHDFLSVEAARAIPSSPPPRAVRDAIAPTRTWTLEDKA